MRARVIGGPDDELLVDGLPLPQRVGDEHDRLLVERQVVHARPGRLHAEVVLVLDVDSAVRLLGDLDDVRRAFQTIVTVPLVDDGPVRVYYGVHVPRVRVVIVGVHQRREDRVRQPPGALVDVPHGVGGTREDDAIDVHDVVVLVAYALLPVRQDLHVEYASVLAKVDVLRELAKYLAYALPGVLPSLARGDVAVFVAPGRCEGLGIVIVRLLSNNKTKD